MAGGSILYTRVYACVLMLDTLGIKITEYQNRIQKAQKQQRNETTKQRNETISVGLPRTVAG